MRARTLSVAIVGVVSVLVYSSSFECGFVFDDHRAILTNDDLDASKTSVWGLFTNDFWGGSMSRRESHKSYRPLTVLTFRYLNHYFSGLEPAGYHVVNVALHAVASVLFLFAAEVILGSVGMWPTYAALLFATHSIHTEAVASTVGRAEVLCSIFFILSFLAYVKAILKSPTVLNSSKESTSWLQILLSVLLAVLALLSKEQGITVLGVSIVFDVLLHWPVIMKAISVITVSKTGREGRNGIMEASHCSAIVNESNTSNGHIRSTASLPSICQESVQAVVRRIGFLLSAGILIMWLRISLNNGGEPIFKQEEMRAAFHPNRSTRILSFCNIYSWNAWLLLAPSLLCCDWSLGSIPLVTSLFDNRNIFFLLLFTTLLALSVFTLQTGHTRARVEVGMGLAMLVVTFFPASGLVFRVGFVIAERVLYLPSMGMCILVIAGARNIARAKHRMSKLVHFSLLYLLLVMSLKTWSRNMDWRSDLSLYESGVKVNPNNVKLVNNYAMELKAAGRFKEAQQNYLVALKMEPGYADLYFNYGNLLSEMQDYTQAAQYFEEALVYPQTYSKTLNNLATTYYRLRRYKEAEERFKESLKLEPDQPTTYNNLASLYGETKRFAESEQMFRKAIKLNPLYVEAYFNIGTLLYQIGRIEEAKENLHHALKLNPQHTGARNNLYVIEYYSDKDKAG